MTTRRSRKDKDGPQGRRRDAGDAREAADARDAARGLYVYCVGEHDELAGLFDEELPEAIEPGEPLEMINGAGLAAVASAIPLSQYGEEQLGARLADAEWVAVRAMRHERVVEHFARRAAVVPLRFGTIYLRRDGVGAMLEERGGGLRAAIGRLRGRDEWGVNVYWDRARLSEKIVELSARLKELNERAESAPPGRAYLLRRQVDATRADEARAEAGRATEEIERRLAAASVASARLRVSGAEAAERRELAAKFAFLVERARFGEFRAAAEELARERADAGLRLELAGPLPAYSFVSGSSS